MRLTEKDTQHFSYNLDTNISSDDTNGYDVRGGNHVSEVIAKLGQLEDIEEELGIDLMVFIKCLTLLNQDKFTYVYWLDKRKDYYMEVITPTQFLVDLEHKEFIQTRREKGYEQHLKFKDYGKTWALTREELTNGR